MQISFGGLRQVFSGFYPKEVGKAALGLSVKMGAATVQAFGLICFAKACEIAEIKFHDRDFTKIAVMPLDSSQCHQIKNIYIINSFDNS